MGDAERSSIEMASYADRRFSSRLEKYWEQLKGARLFPEENEIDPDELQGMWENCFLLQVRDMENVQDYNFTYLGPHIIETYANGVLDEDNQYLISPNASRLNASFKKVLETGQPLSMEGEFVNARGKTVKFRQRLMPLGGKSVKVEAIFGGMWFKLTD